VELALIFKGANSSWTGLKPKLEPSLRGPVAYVFGHHRARLNQSQQAAAFFRDALDAAAPGSTLEKLAKSELAKIK
jgi:hypothetical protein